jgi:uncharacterized cupredoxin-like copper-binding protein
MGLTGARRVVALVALGATVIGTGYAGSAVLLRGERAAAVVQGSGEVTVHIRIRNSAFSPRRIRVRRHTVVRFVLDNRDPIAHEFIVGGPDVHARHENGHEPWHPPVDGEVSIGPDSVAETLYHFHEIGPVLFACHLPGHFQFGMTGTVLVRAA